MCVLYGKPSFLDINELRYHLLCIGDKARKNWPTSPMLRCPEVPHHACRLSSCHLEESLEAKPDIPHPRGHGWTLDAAGVLSIHWMDQLPAPQALLEVVSCGCTTGRATRRCTCKTHGMPCTDVCQCSRPGCKNVQRTRDGGDKDDLTSSENEGDARLTSDEES